MFLFAQSDSTFFADPAIILGHPVTGSPLGPWGQGEVVSTAGNFRNFGIIRFCPPQLLCNQKSRISFNFLLG